jgi:hypothetical protein
MAVEITSLPYRNRHTFPAQTTTTTNVAVVGGNFPMTIGDVDVGDVSVGQQEVTTEGSYGYRDRFQFDVDELT